MNSTVRYFFAFVVLLALAPRVSGQQLDDILLEVEDREVTAAEFVRLWDKTNELQEPGSINDYLELFINFQLKVAHAREEGIHREESFKKEFAQFRRKLAAPYMGDPGLEEKLAREAYERLLYDVNASHILVRIAPSHSPQDTVRAWEKAMEIRQQLLDGEPFEKLAVATSDDPGAKINSGNLGFFTALQTDYAFENAVYNAEPGEIEMPVRTRFGYHVIRVNERRESRGEVKTAHIMIGFNQYNEQEAKNKVTDVYNQIKAGENFEALAGEHSTDFNTAARGGLIGWFGSGRFVPEFENAAFSLSNPGDISEPFLSPYGWHIIKLMDRRDRPPFDEARSKLLEAIRDPSGSRSGLIRNALVERLKAEWQFSENREGLNLFYRLVDDSIFEGRWTAPENLPLNGVLFSVTGKTYTQRDFAEFISQNAYARKPWPLTEYINNLYEDFVSHRLVELEDNNLENKYPEFGYMMNEYRDGMLLYEISSREIWSRAMSDSAGLAEYYENNIHDYMWDERISASIYSTSDSRLASRTRWRARRSRWFSGRDDEWVTGRLNRSAEEDVVTYESGLFSRGEREITDIIEWDEGVSDVHSVNDHYKVVLIHEILEPEPKALEETRGHVIADYQDYLEDIWIETLREKYNVTVNKDVMSAIINQNP